MQVPAVVSCVLLACIATSFAADTTHDAVRPKRDIDLLKSLLSKIISFKIPKLPLPIGHEVGTLPLPPIVPVPPPIVEVPDCETLPSPPPPPPIVPVPPPFVEVPDCETLPSPPPPPPPIVEVPDCDTPLINPRLRSPLPLTNRRLRPPLPMVRLPPPPPFIRLPIFSPMAFVPRSMQIYPPPPPLLRSRILPSPMPFPLPAVRVAPPRIPIFPPPRSILPYRLPILPPLKKVLPPIPMPISPPFKPNFPPAKAILLPPPMSIFPPPPMPVLPLLPQPIIIPSFRYLHNQKNQDGSITTTYSKDGKDTLVTTIDDKLKIPPAVIVDRVEKIVSGVPFLPVIAGPEPVRPISRPLSEIIAPRPIDVGGQWTVEAYNKPDVIGTPLSIPPPPMILETSDDSSIHKIGYSSKLNNDKGYFQMRNGENIYYNTDAEGSRNDPHYGGPRLPLIVNGHSEPGAGMEVREDAVKVTMTNISREPFGIPDSRPFIRPPSLTFYGYKKGNSKMTEPAAVADIEHSVPFESRLPGYIMNSHEHIRPDGSKYICFENHSQGHPTILDSDRFPYKLPTLPLESRLTRNIIKTGIANEEGSSKNENIRGSLKFSDTSSLIDPSKSAESEELSLSKNPIVVQPSDSEHTFSHKVTNLDGSSIDVLGDGNNMVSVKINNGNNNERRGDIPELLL